MNADCSPVTFIGLDGAEPTLLRRWMADGTLPVLAGIAASGTCRDVETLPGMGDGATWPTLICGAGPARHGRYFRRQIRCGSHERYLFDVQNDFACTPFWEPASKAGRKVAILDLPYSPAVPDLNGVQITDWLIHDRYGAVRGHPKAFVTDVLAEFGDDPLEGDSDRYRRADDCMEHVLDLLIQRVQMKASLVRKVVEGDRFDLLATSFTEAHDAGHLMWHLHDPMHPRHDAAWRTAHGDPIRRLYQEMDAAIGRILEDAEPSGTVALFAGLGMGPNYTANNVLETVVNRLDGRKPPARVRKRLQSMGAPAPVLKLGGRLDNVLRHRSESGARFFALPHNENSGAIRINLEGREPHGRVCPEDFEQTCDEIADAFKELVNPETGRPVVEEVVKISEHYTGERRVDLPDLLVVWRRSEPFSAIYSPRVGRIEDAGSWGRTGDHTANAMLILRGPAGKLASCRQRVRVVDVAPTISAMLGVPMPDVEGTPICER
ncbi:MAG: alkaline phosphatase family protein [Pseudomonadales bacterium]